jgi:hypothetical protein
MYRLDIGSVFYYYFHLLYLHVLVNEVALSIANQGVNLRLPIERTGVLVLPEII